MNKLVLDDSYEYLQTVESNTVDCVVTDPPYGMSFMLGNINWDRALVPVKHWREICRVLKSGSMSFIMSIPRQDLLARMIINLEDAGFRTNFTSLYWVYATGFLKIHNISKAFDREACREELEQKLGRKPTKKEFEQAWKSFRQVIGPSPNARASRNPYQGVVLQKYRDKAVIDLPKTDLAKKYNGSYGGYQPAPACEVILVVMKPMTEETYIKQARKNEKSITWLDDVKIPVPEDDIENYDYNKRGSYERAINPVPIHEGGFKPLTPEDLPDFSESRFPSNLIVSDNVLGDHYTKFFDLDAWWKKKIKELPLHIQKTFPFWIVPKPSQAEKNKNCENIRSKVKVFRAGEALGGALVEKEVWGNYHPTCKPVRLMAYLITMGTRENELVLDPFLGSGTTVLACQMLNRKYLGIEKDNGYYTIARARAGLTKKNVKKLFKKRKK